jgi:hypothetical protein
MFLDQIYLTFFDRKIYLTFYSYYISIKNENKKEEALGLLD